MSNNDASTFPGSRWWKCDLHTHTPGSYDFTDPAGRPPDWVKAALEAGVQVVAITDHNDHRWLGRIHEAANGSGLIVFPGVEITVSGGIHILAILPTDTPADAVAALLGACKLPADKFGKQDACSTLSFVDIAAIIECHEGLCLAAHADGEDGFLTKLVTLAPDGTPSGSVTLQQIVTCPQLLGVEANKGDTRLLAFLDNTKEGYRRHDGPLPLLEASDAHALGELGRRWTWIKMSKPDLEGLRLALMDGELSVRRGSRVTGDPNACASDLLECMEIEHARYIGRGRPFRVDLNPWLNAIIGGHGTGKSSVVEFLRIAMRRDEDVPDSLRPEFEKYTKAYENRNDRGLMTPQTVIRVIFRRNGERFRIQWSYDGSVTPIEQWRPDRGWVPAPGDVRSRFPVRIFSQKQIYKLAEDPNALLRIIDENPAVDAISLRAELDREEKTFLSLRAQARAIEAETRDEARLLGALDDVRRKIAVFESSDHWEVLTSYQRVERQQRALDTWAKSFEEAVNRAEQLERELVPEELGAEIFPDISSAGTAEKAVLQAMVEAAARLTEIRREAHALGARARAALDSFRAVIGAAPWAAHVAAARQRYEQLKKELTAAGAGDPSEYGRLVQERQALETRLRNSEARKKTMVELGRQADERLARVARLRAELTERRRRFLDDALGGNEHVLMEVIPYGDRVDAERKLREYIARTDQTFQDQIWSEDGDKGVLRDVYIDASPADGSDKFLTGLAALKTRLVDVARGASEAQLHGKFVAHLRRLPPEALDRIEALFPEDAVSVGYRARAGEDFRPIDQGSPGQKSAAVLAFLLSHGSDPLVLDQPEDDLDNQLVSELIVTQLRQIKTRRQVIVVTHNPNIVVNGDAELVLPLVARNGQTHVDDAGGLQEAGVRDTICRVMEGGREALERRYRRIRGGADHV